MVHVIATIELQPGQREAFLETFRRLVPLVRAAVGCFDYGPAIDIDSGIPIQEPPREDVVIVVERWASLEALRAHLASPHVTEYREQVKDLVATVRLQVLQPV
jgi:quinol monooxygenase YgiN